MAGALLVFIINVWRGGDMLVKTGVVIVEDNCIRMDDFKISEPTTLKEARLEVLHWAAAELQEAISSEEET